MTGGASRTAIAFIGCCAATKSPPSGQNASCLMRPGVFEVYKIGIVKHNGAGDRTPIPMTLVQNYRFLGKLLALAQLYEFLCRTGVPKTDPQPQGVEGQPTIDP